MNNSVEQLAKEVLNNIDSKELNDKLNEYKKAHIPKFLSDVKNFAKEFSQTLNFEKEVNERDYELKVTNLAKSCMINSEIYDDLFKHFSSLLKLHNKKEAFTVYFVLYTMCRRQNFGDFLNLALEYVDDFDEYEIMRHIKLMAILDKATHSTTLFKAIKESEKMVELKNEYCDFTNHTGVLNVYTALICKYFEYQLDERNDGNNKELLIKALKCIKNAIDLEKEEKGSYDLVYPKFYLNYGRILILLGKYDKGEAEIQKAIRLLQDSADRQALVTEYNQYLLKSSIIHSYDLNEEKIKDLDKIKVNNYKSIALMTTLLGFLLGAINIFTTITDPFTFGMLMLCYAGLLFVLLGSILLGLTLTFKEQKARLYIYDVLLIIFGVIIFGVTLALILMKKG